MNTNQANVGYVDAVEYLVIGPDFDVVVVHFRLVNQC
jgi:hypothetical protein